MPLPPWITRKKIWSWQKKYEVGTGSQIEIVAAQTEMKSAQTNYVSALYDAIIAKVDYLKATGKL
jgi:outer membrane protein TolC